MDYQQECFKILYSTFSLFAIISCVILLFKIVDFFTSKFREKRHEKEWDKEIKQRQEFEDKYQKSAHGSIVKNFVTLEMTKDEMKQLIESLPGKNLK